MRQVIYIRIPKCAGTSIKKHFKPDMGRVGKGRFNTDKQFIDFYCDPLSVNLKNKSKLGKIWTDSYKFAIVRNPYSRLVSGYEYCKAHTSPNTQKDFSDFVKTLNDVDLNEFERKHIKRKQTDHLIDECNQLLKIESLDSDFALLCRNIGVEYSPLGHRNATHYSDYKTYYNLELQHIVYREFKEDFEFLKYPKSIS